MPSNKMPLKRVMRQARQAAGERMFEASALRDILASLAGEAVARFPASPNEEPVTIPGRANCSLRAMVLLGLNLNAGFGQHN